MATNDRNRERYANDPEYRERRKAAARAEYRRKKENTVTGDEWRVKRNAIRAERQRKIKDRISTLKEAGSCADCGQQYPACVMDYDHVRGEKVERVARLAVNRPWSVIEAEIAKCDLVCANCHRLRTRDRSKESDTAP